MKDFKIDILGELYKVCFRDATDPRLENADGYCDWTTNEIVVRQDWADDVHNLKDLNVYKLKVLKHELIHAFLFESGLAENSWGTNEEIVDWIALQFDKIVNAFDRIEAMYE